MAHPCDAMVALLNDPTCVTTFALEMTPQARRNTASAMRTVAAFASASYVGDAYDFRSVISAGFDLVKEIKRAAVTELKAQITAIFQSQAGFANCPAMQRVVGLLRAQLDDLSASLGADSVRQNLMNSVVGSGTSQATEISNYLTTLANCIENVGTY